MSAPELFGFACGMGTSGRSSRGTPTRVRRACRMTIIAQDPAFRLGDGGTIVRAAVAVPADRLEPGPRSHRFHVVDYDSTAGTYTQPADLAGADGAYRDRFASATDAELLDDPAFHAQNVYAIAARTLSAFEFALGRRIEWSCRGHQLYLVPHAFLEGNAFYSRDDSGVLFGYLPREDGTTIHTCLSHDIVAHEVTHAILDGLRPRFLEPGLPDQTAFHEALGDVAALLSVFSVPEVVDAALDAYAGASDAIDTDEQLRAELAKSALFGVAEQFGAAIEGTRGSALRRSLTTVSRGDEWKRMPEFDEPHRRGEVLVAALMRTLLAMWTDRLRALAVNRAVSVRTAGEEGAKAAAHLLTMVIRALDYAPAVELEFDDVVESILVADEVVAPDDEHGYRDAVKRAFHAYGIGPPGCIHDVSIRELSYALVNAAALRASRDEVFRFIWQNLGALELDPSYELQVQAVRPAARVGPDGLLVQEVVADYVQVLDLTAGEAEARGVTRPSDVALTTPLQLWGGGTLIFDQFGRLKLHVAKRLDDWERQSRRLAYLAREGLYDEQGRLGFSTGGPSGMTFADLHVRVAVPGEEW